MQTIIPLLVSILVAQLAGIIGSLFTMEAIPTWYASLVRPSIAPPNWVFGPVWTLLYTLMGVASYLIWKKRNTNTFVRKALIVYACHLLINASWSIVFFRLQRLDLALLVIVILLGFIVWTMYLFGHIDRRSQLLFLPYLAWVSFATILNFSFWRLNA